MPSNNSKYTREIREQTARFILETGKSATSVAEEMDIDKNTGCPYDNSCMESFFASLK